MIRRVKKINPSCLLIVCGCLVNTNLNDLLSLNNIDILVENNDKDKISQIISEYFSGNIKAKPFIFKTSIDGSFNHKLGRMSMHSRAFLKIQDGCDNYCSFCKIPFARGSSRSRDINDIINDIKLLKKNNYEEVVLTGINLGSYNFKNLNISDLLNIISDKFLDVRFRISSIEPQCIDEKFIKAFKRINICPHLHVPLQNGSDKILRLMSRKYSVRQYLEKIEMIRNAYCDAFISTDLIIGFPGEYEEDFNMTVDLVKAVKFSFIHIFGYSPRARTKAFLLKDRIPERIRDNRIQIIKELVEKFNLEYRRKFIDKTLEIIIEEKKGKYYIGKSENYLNIHLNCRKKLLPKRKYKILFYKVQNKINFGKLI